MRAILTLLLTAVSTGIGWIAIGAGYMLAPWPSWLTRGWPYVGLSVVMVIVVVSWAFACGHVVRWLMFRGDEEDVDFEDDNEPE